jgi:hypothetical protein
MPGKEKVEKLDPLLNQGNGFEVYITSGDMTRSDGSLLFKRLMSRNTNMKRAGQQ